MRKMRFARMSAAVVVMTGLVSWVLLPQDVNAQAASEPDASPTAPPSSGEPSETPLAAYGYWDLNGNAGTDGYNFLGTVDDRSLFIRVNNRYVMRYYYNTSFPNNAPNVQGGYVNNMVQATVSGAVIAGGGCNTCTNVVNAHFGVIGGGAANVAGDPNGTANDGAYATVGGGWGNGAFGYMSVVAGGRDNRAGDSYQDQYAAVGGGWSNKALDDYATVSGGYNNEAQQAYSTVAGGNLNRAQAAWATVGGGYGNSAETAYATVAGGQSNRAGLSAATVSGGVLNLAIGANSVVAGGQYNTANEANSVVAGGQSNTGWAPNSVVAGGQYNTAQGDSSVVAGGAVNTAAQNAAAVLGGTNNDASGSYSVVGGGFDNSAVGMMSTVPGGYRNTANGTSSFAGGNYATVATGHDYAFVWSGTDNTAGTTSFGAKTFTVRAPGGVRFYSHDTSLGIGVQLLAGDSQWLTLCDRNAKENITAVNPRTVLDKVSSLPITTWTYKGNPNRHMGPMAQDFRAAFGLGADDKTIAMLDPSGVALAAVQGLHAIAKEQESRIGALERDNDRLQARLDRLERAMGGGPASSPGPLGALLATAGLGLGIVLVGRRKQARSET